MLVIALALAAATAQTESPRAIIERAVQAAGGEVWLNPGTLWLEGTADFYSPTQPGPVRHAERYTMWRVPDPQRAAAHAADGKIRITIISGGKTMVDVGFDGATTWNEKGIVPKAEADKFWAENFGFGIIRTALAEGFRLEHAPAREIGGHRLKLVRVIDPQGQATLFGFDARTHYIRYMGFATPRGWHERVYDDFVVGRNPRWLQAREVTLYYNGVKQNVLHWQRFRIGQPIPDSVFAMPPAYGKIMEKPE
jgi:hypothetical protein